MDLDLHIHSNVSDGTITPSGVVSAAIEANLDVIAITDHDTVMGVEEAVRAAAGHPIEVIPAIEISASDGEVELHILGYFVDPTDEALRAHTQAAAERRESRMREMVGRLSDQGVEITFDAVSAVSSGRGTLGRPHLARALKDAGYVDTVPEAFDTYIGNPHPAYIPTSLLNPEQSIALIRQAGGVAVWAHPSFRHVVDWTPTLQRQGLQGLEVYRPRTPRHRVFEMERLARERGLLVSGGSDWHGPDQGNLGEFRVNATEVAALLAKGGI